MLLTLDCHNKVELSKYMVNMICLKNSKFIHLLLSLLKLQDTQLL